MWMRYGRETRRGNKLVRGQFMLHFDSSRGRGACKSRKPEPHGPRRGGLTRDLHSIVVILRGLFFALSRPLYWSLER